MELVILKSPCTSHWTQLRIETVRRYNELYQIVKMKDKVLELLTTVSSDRNTTEESGLLNCQSTLHVSFIPHSHLFLFEQGTNIVYHDFSLTFLVMKASDN